MLQVTKETFEEQVVKNTQPVLIDFYADWCGPCRGMEPMIEELAKQYDGRAQVVKINIDQNMEIAQQHGVMSIPTFVFYKDGKEQDRLVGSQSKDKLMEVIDRLV